jgi:hypothetical protein
VRRGRSCSRTSSRCSPLASSRHSFSMRLEARTLAPVLPPAAAGRAGARPRRRHTFMRPLLRRPAPAGSRLRRVPQVAALIARRAVRAGFFAMAATRPGALRPHPTGVDGAGGACKSPLRPDG